MRLISCHIENFGKLSDFTMNFESGYNELCYENGWGKSTLAAFIKVMFFGFEGGRKHSLENERKFYSPWQGGVFGGQLTFEVGGKTYTLSRVFGNKEREDVFEIRNAETNLECSDYSTNIGPELFEIDGESFKRSVFISQNDCLTNATGDINAKMGNIADNMDDLNTYDDAMNRIKDYLNANSPTKKTGLIWKLKDRATGLETNIKKEDSLNNTLDELQKSMNKEKKKLSDSEKELEKITKQQKNVSLYKQTQAKKESYEDLNNQVKKAELEWQESQKKFPGRVPEKNEVEYNSEICTHMNTYKTKAETYLLNNEEEGKLESFNEKFVKGIPSEAEFDEVKGKNTALFRYRQEDNNSQLSDEDIAKLEMYKEKFGNDEHVLERIDELQDLWVERTSKAAELSQKRYEMERVTSSKENNKPVSKKNVPLMVSGIIVLIIGVVVFMKALIPGVVIAAIGAALLIFSFVKKNSVETSANSNFEDEKISLKKEITSFEKRIEYIEKEVRTFLEKVDVEFDINTVHDELQDLMKNAARYEALLERYAKARDNNHKEECDRLSEEIVAFLNLYRVECSEEAQFINAINYLENEIGEYDRLKEKKLNWIDANKRFIDKENKVKEFLYDLKFIPEEDLSKQINHISELLSDYTYKKNMYEKDLRRKEEFEEKNNIEKLMNLPVLEGETDLVKLSEAYESKTSDIDSIKDSMQFYKSQYENVANELDDLLADKEELHKLKEDIASDSYKYKMIKNTQELLTAAKEKLTAKYMGPLKNSFSKYYKIITETDAENYIIDANANIKVRELGLPREISSYSAGYKDLIGICMRLSFIDAMYEKEKPMIILDDPFVNFDTNKLDAGKRLLKGLEKEYQVIYFTCNESR